MMSPNKSKRGAVAISDSSPEPVPSCSKRPRPKMSSDDEEDAVPKKAVPSKHGSQSKRSPGFTSHNKPAELFRKDLISAMKLADSEPLQDGSYFLISDPWRQEWEKGVQVPVNMTEIMQAQVREIREKSKGGSSFKMPHKLLHERVDSSYKKGLHELTGMQQLSEQLVRYDLDDLDVCWLEEVNFRRREMGLAQVSEWDMERTMEVLENQCHEKMSALMKTEEGMGIEYDEDIVCDVCCSPESEDTNEMVFCDGCDVCIHQACYGIQSIPEGSWLCRTCALGIKPKCMLCPKVGGAMKSTRSGTKWAHVSCALWIPEVSIGIPEKMEPITKISNIPPSRWALLCCLCKEREGACIQCSVKTCKTAFHVTCGFSNGLEMKTILDETDEHDGVKLKAYCPKHTKKRERGHSESDTDSPRRENPPTTKKEMTQQERDNLRAKKLKSLEEDFHSQVSVSEACSILGLEKEIVDLIYVFWKLKRKGNWDKPLLTPKTEEADMLEKQQEDSLVARMKMFVHLRQDLERVRNLCYMIGKREKTKRQFFRSKEYVFTSMVRVLLDKSMPLSTADVDDIVHNYHFDSIYDDYGLSVQHLPQESSQDEDLPVEVEEKEEKAVPVDSQQDVESAVEEAVEETVPEEPAAEDEEVEDMSQALSPGERWSGEFVRTGFFKRRRHKKWMKGHMFGKAQKKKVQPVVSSPDRPPSPVKPSKIQVDDDNVFNTSADESDEEKEKLAAVVKAITEMEDKSDEGCDTSPVPIPRLSLQLHRSKKRHRGRKPWHMKEPYRYDLDSNLNFSTDDDEDMKVTPVTSRVAKDREDTSVKPVTVDVVGNDNKANTSDENMLIDIEGQNSPVHSSFLEQLKNVNSDSLLKPAQVSPAVNVEQSVNSCGSVKTKPNQVENVEEESRRTKSKGDKSEDSTKHGSAKKRSEKRRTPPADETTSTEKVKSECKENPEPKTKLRKSKTPSEHKVSNSEDVAKESSGMENKSENELAESSSVQEKEEKREVRKKSNQSTTSRRSSRRENRKSGQKEFGDSSNTTPAQRKGRDSKSQHIEDKDPDPSQSDSKHVVPVEPPLAVEHDMKQTKKDKDTSDSVKAEAEQPFRDSLTFSLRRKNSGSGTSGERSNIFESMERHCRQGSLDMGLERDERDQTSVSELSKEDQSVNWRGKLRHVSALGKSTQLSGSSDHWFYGGPLKKDPQSEHLLNSDSLDSSEKLFDKHVKPVVNDDKARKSLELDSAKRNVCDQDTEDVEHVNETDKGPVLVPAVDHSLKSESDENSKHRREPNEKNVSESKGEQQLMDSINQVEVPMIPFPAEPAIHLPKAKTEICDSADSVIGTETASKIDSTGLVDHGDVTDTTKCVQPADTSCQKNSDAEVKDNKSGNVSSFKLRRKRHHQPEEADNHSVQAHVPEKRRRKSSVQVEEVRQDPNLSNSQEIPHQKSSHRTTRGHDASPPVEPRMKFRRKSSHEARLKLNKVLTAADSSSDDDFEPDQPKFTAFPRRLRHDRLTKKLVLKRHKKRQTSSEESSEDEGNSEANTKEGEEQQKRGSFHWERREQPRRNSSADKTLRTQMDGLSPDLTRLLKPSDLIVEDTLVKRVEDSLLKRYKHRTGRHHTNGIAHDQQWKIVPSLGKINVIRSNLASKDSGRKEDLETSGDRSLPKTRVLNEITPERSSNFQTNIFGAHYSPRGSLSGYKIPKKNSGQSAGLAVSSSSLPTSLSSSGPFGGRTDFSSFKALAASGTAYLPHPTEGTFDEKLQKKCVVADGGVELDATSTVGNEQGEVERLSLDNCSGYRSHSPASDASIVMARHSDSRESTPRRVTRSQLMDEPVENSPSPHGMGVCGRNKVQLRDGVLKASHFTS